VSGTDLLIVDYASLGLSPQAMNLLSSGGLSSDSFVKGVGVRALDPNDHFLLDTAQSLLMFDPDGSGSMAPLALLQFQGMVDSRINSADVFIGI
jgi:hypothetical protein